MIVVIQCAGRKTDGAGYFQNHDGRRVMFVADPESAPPDNRMIYARPDDHAADGETWRVKLETYNRAPEHNPFGLLPAWRLYANDAYRLLCDRFGADKLYILSAGWGLIRSDFLTPNYDITFSNQANRLTRRRDRDSFEDFRMLPEDAAEPILFYAGKAYVDLAVALTKRVKGEKLLFYNSAVAPRAPGFSLRRYETTTRTNWHYECAKAFVAGAIDL